MGEHPDYTQVNALSADRLRELLSYDPATGIFRWKFSNRRAKSGKICGSIHKRTGYVEIYVEFKNYLAHRLAWLYMTGAWPQAQIDHINGMRSDNRFDNLRDVPPRANSQNRFGISGTTPSGSGYKAQIGVCGKTIYLGTFNTEEEASGAYLEAKKRLHDGIY